MIRPLLFAATVSLSLLAVTAPSWSQDADTASASANSLAVDLVPPVRANNLTLSAPIFSPVGSLTRVTVQVTNPTNRQRHLDYEFQWFNAAGAPRQTLTASQSLFLDPHETQTILSVGQHADAVSAHVLIREHNHRDQ